MGMDAEAHLFYGYHWDEGELNDDSLWSPGCGEEWSEVLYDSRPGSIQIDWDSYPKVERSWSPNPQESQAVRIWQERWSTPMDNRRAAIAKIEEEFGCDVSWSGAESCESPYAFVTASHVATDWGMFKEVHPVNMTQTIDSCKWEDMLDRFLKALNMKPIQESPGWYLAARYW